jgi:glycosyltransferase involved in cell wall biosynthesis
MECIKAGLPSIATNYSAHTEYLTTENDYPEALLLNKLTEEVANDGRFFRGDRGTWMAPDIDEISEKLDYVYSNYTEIKQDFNADKIKQQFTWQNSATKLIEALKQVT